MITTCYRLFEVMYKVKPPGIVALFVVAIIHSTIYKYIYNKCYNNTTIIVLFLETIKRSNIYIYIYIIVWL